MSNEPDKGLPDWSNYFNFINKKFIDSTTFDNGFYNITMNINTPFSVLDIASQITQMQDQAFKRHQTFDILASPSVSLSKMISTIEYNNSRSNLIHKMISGSISYLLAEQMKYTLQPKEFDLTDISGGLLKVFLLIRKIAS